MDVDRFNNTVTAFRQRVLFRPFTVTLANGDRFEVDHPSALVVRDGLREFIAPGGLPVLFDHEGVSQVAGDLLSQSPD